MITQAVLQNGLSSRPPARSKYDQRPCSLIALVGSSTPEVAPIGFDRNACVYRQGGASRVSS
jgi:hypothetical protein